MKIKEQCQACEGLGKYMCLDYNKYMVDSISSPLDLECCSEFCDDEYCEDCKIKTCSLCSNSDCVNGYETCEECKGTGIYEREATKEEVKLLKEKEQPTLF